MNDLDKKIAGWLADWGQTEAINKVKKKLNCSAAEAKEIVDKFLKDNPNTPIHKTTVKGTLITIAVFIGLIIIIWAGCKACGGNSSTDAPQKTTRKERVDALFSAWDGDQPAVKQWIKSQLRDPESYKNISTKFGDRVDSIYVIVEFTAKNGFGGRNRLECQAYVDTLGHFMHGEIFRE